MARHDQLQWKVDIIEKSSEKSSAEKVISMVKRAKEALELYDKAVTENRPDEARQLDEEISDIAKYISLLDTEHPWHRRLNKFFGVVALAAACGCILLFVKWYTFSPDTRQLASIESVRPILVIAAIISTIVFGGTLIVASLFSAEGSFDERFRRAREVFLVFSGIFGTVFGFYFGAGESKQQLIFDAIRNNNTVTAYASGGTPPYKVTKGQETKDAKDGFASFDIKPEEKDKDIVVSAVDSKGLPGKKTLEPQGEKGVAGVTGATATTVVHAPAAVENSK